MEEHIMMVDGVAQYARNRVWLREELYFTPFAFP
jgi:hypothetical protein